MSSLSIKCGSPGVRCSMGQLLRTKRHTATGKQSQVLVVTEPPHARHTCLRQSTADQGCVLRHGVVLGIAIDFGGLLNAAVDRRRLCNSSAQSSPGRRLSALAMCLVERVSWHQEGYLVRILISMTCRQR